MCIRDRNGNVGCQYMELEDTDDWEEFGDGGKYTGTQMKSNRSNVVCIVDAGTDGRRGGQLLESLT